MAMITPALLTELQRTWRQDFQNGLAMAPSQYKKIASVIPSSSGANVYGWLGKFPMLREWIGARVIESMKSDGYMVPNKLFEGTVGVSRVDIEDDNLGIYATLFQEMGLAAEQHPDIHVFEALANGFDQPCYDGQNFFDTEHPIYPNPDGTGTPKMHSNVYMPDADWKGLPWFVLDTSRAIKPIIYQERTKAELEMKYSAANSDHVFMLDEYLHGVRMRNNVGYGFWQMAMAGLAELNADNLWEVIQRMRTIEADGGRKLSMKPTMLVVPPGLEKVATRLLERELDASMNGTTSNELRNRLELLVADYL
ncbi:Mu-like prophage major head subunit gpT family protein [Aeromonas piscicola]|uniref:Mu-like prophage major head subunit gpT family protein n=1 Tax=Aeromonas piscicola TaxID=600645 RepID=UPI0005B3284A|nr:Mu-like prophage major head subunit gpT family protein [Aeromonas piscicola]